jgi:hypothetical protein
MDFSNTNLTLPFLGLSQVKIYAHTSPTLTTDFEFFHTNVEDRIALSV